MILQYDIIFLIYRQIIFLIYPGATPAGVGEESGGRGFWAREMGLWHGSDGGAGTRMSAEYSVAEQRSWS
jgi:hypothetical protein